MINEKYRNNFHAAHTYHADEENEEIDNCVRVCLIDFCVHEAISATKTGCLFKCIITH